jgi:hypothetical protein
MPPKSPSSEVRYFAVVNSVSDGKTSKIDLDRQGSLFKTHEGVGTIPETPPIVRQFDHSRILTGTSAFTAAGWAGSFYRAEMKSENHLSYYASKFKAVEIDSTYYGIAAASTVES